MALSGGWAWGSAGNGSLTLTLEGALTLRVRGGARALALPLTLGGAASATAAGGAAPAGRVEIDLLAAEAASSSPLSSPTGGAGAALATLAFRAAAVDAPVDLGAAELATSSAGGARALRVPLRGELEGALPLDAGGNVLLNASRVPARVEVSLVLATGGDAPLPAPAFTPLLDGLL
jgi:hypothetical protein